MSAEKTVRVDSTLSKGLAILETLSESRRGIGVSELSRRLELTKSNTFRLLQTLATLGYVNQQTDKTYAASLKGWQVGRSVVENLNLRAVASDMMSYLANETGETIYLAVRDNLQVVYIDKIDSQKPIRSWNPIGGSAPLHCVGTGKAILSAEYPALRDVIGEHLKGFTERTITDLASLDAAMRESEARGFAVDTGEFREGVYSIGSAILLPDGSAAGALGVSVPNVNLPDNGVDKLGGLVAHAAQSVTKKLALL
ncbi:MAG: IclR family transcriptional regulator [Pseudomonadota bacterium]